MFTLVKCSSKSSWCSDFADGKRRLAAVFMQVPQGLIRGNGGASHNLSTLSLVPFTTVGGEKGREVHNYQAHVTHTSDTFPLQQHCSFEQKGHRLFGNSVFKDFNHKVYIV